jgi:hypothetical protein
LRAASEVKAKWEATRGKRKMAAAGPRALQP